MAEKCSLKLLKKNKLKRFDFEQNSGIENWNGKPKQKNFNNLRKISDFEQNVGLRNKTKNQNRKIGTNRERFLILNEMPELSNET